MRRRPTWREGGGGSGCGSGIILPLRQTAALAEARLPSRRGLLEQRGPLSGQASCGAQGASELASGKRLDPVEVKTLDRAYRVPPGRLANTAPVHYLSADEWPQSASIL